MVTVKEHKNNTYEAYKKMSNFELTAGENLNTVREKRLTSVKNNLKILNDQASIFYNDDLIIAEIEGILQGINELCPEIVYHAGKAKLNGEVITYEFKEIYHYELLKPGAEATKYCITKKLYKEKEHKINGADKGKFAVDTEYKFIILST